ncbi:MAG: hypothetical protein DI558_02840 [Corynebacterium propinquum]|nr:MAG: hypothetical protein DI558_02840 [Corynebacterium propinquum]
MYLVDTNILLNAFNYYPRSVFPSYWKVFEARFSSGEFCVHEQVYEELKKKTTIRFVGWRPPCPKTVC